MKNTKLRCYFVSGEDDGGFAVIAFKSKDAKKFIIRSGELSDYDFTDIRVKWQKDVNVEGLKEGDILYDLIDGIRRGAYGYAEDVRCPCCGEEDFVSGQSGVVGCDKCMNPDEYNKTELKRAYCSPTLEQQQQGLKNCYCEQLYVCYGQKDFPGEVVFGCDLQVGEVPSTCIPEKCATGGINCIIKTGVD